MRSYHCMECGNISYNDDEPCEFCGCEEWEEEIIIYDMWS